MMVSLHYLVKQRKMVLLQVLARLVTFLSVQPVDE